MLVNSSKLIQSIYNRYSEDQKFDEFSNGIKIMVIRFVEKDIYDSMKVNQVNGEKKTSNGHNF